MFMRNFVLSLVLLGVGLSFAACSSPPSGNANTDAGNGSVSADGSEYADARSAYDAGMKFLDDSENEKAVAAFSRAVELDPEMADAYFQLGIAYTMIEARDVDQGNVEPTPTPEPGTKKPKERKLNSDLAFEKAVEAYKKQIEKDPKDDAAYFNLGRAYNKLDEDEDAAKALRQAVKLKPDDTIYQTELGAILTKLAKYAEAIPPLKKALELDAENLKAMELLERAEAGQKRVGYAQPKPSPSKTGGTDEESGDEAEGETKPGNGKDEPKPKPSPAKPNSPAANRPAKPASN